MRRTKRRSTTVRINNQKNSVAHKIWQGILIEMYLMYAAYFGRTTDAYISKSAFWKQAQEAKFQYLLLLNGLQFELDGLWWMGAEW